MLVGISTTRERIEAARTALLEAGAVQVLVSTKHDAAHAAGGGALPDTAIAANIA